MSSGLRPDRATFPAIVCLVGIAGLATLGLAFAGPRLGGGSSRSGLSSQDGSLTAQVHPVKVVARKFSFSPSRIEVQENDLVKITLETLDIPHSFTIDDAHYRVAKRVTPNHPVEFEFRADKVGTFPFYCSLKTDDGCRNMRGELVVKARK